MAWGVDSGTNVSECVSRHYFMQELISLSPEETVQLGYQFGKSLLPNSVVCFFGDLAAGKTTFIKGIVAGAAAYPQEHVNSPTFVYLNIYRGEKQTVYHFDLYRLHDAEEFLSMGFDELFSADGICCIEWAEKIESILPSDAIHVEMHHDNKKETKRHITIK